MSVISWSGSSGSWDNAANWGGVLPTSADVALVSASGSYAVTIGSASSSYVDQASSLVLMNSGATVQSGAPIGQTARLLLSNNLILAAGMLDLRVLQLQGGTVRTRGGTYLFGSNSLLDGVSWEGNLDLTGSASGTVLALKDGFTLLQTGALQPVLNVGGQTVTAINSETLDNLTIRLNGGSLLGPTDFGSTLTLGSGASVIATGLSAIGAGGSGIVANYGSITLQHAVGSSTAYQMSLAGEVDNYGFIQIGNFATLATGAATFVNGGEITVAAGTLSLGTTALAAGAISFISNASTVNFAATEGYSATLYGFQAGDKLTFAGAAATYGGLALNGQVLSVLDVFGNSIADLTIEGSAPDLGQFSPTFNGDGSVTIGTSQAAAVVTDPDFDAAYYLSQNPDVAAAGVDPLTHYNTFGWREGRSPSPFFNTNYYLTKNPDVAAAGINPLQHYEQSGWIEGRDPSAAFSTSGYDAANPDVANAHIDPLAHYLSSGRYEGRAAVPVSTTPPSGADLGVDYAYYYAQHPDVLAAGIDAATHYNTIGWKLGYNPDPYFDTKFYLTNYKDIAVAGINPLAHFESSGWREGRDPSLAFSNSHYLAAYPEVANAGIDPLIHYLQFGRYEGRMAFISGPTATGPADSLVNPTYYFGQLATIVPTTVDATASYDQTGWHLGLNPDAFFDTKYYLAQYPDIAAAGINPLAHYESSGWREGRNPSALFSTNKYEQAYGVTTDPLLDYYQGGAAAGRVNIPV